MSGAGPEETHNPAKGWSKGPLTILGIVVLCFAVFFLVYALLM